MGRGQWAHQTLIGHKFGMLTVLEKTEPRSPGRRWWLCLCKCGKTTIVPTDKLTNGNTTSCGCKLHYPNLIGARFGKLIVVEALGIRKSFSIWKCKCDCGGEKIVRTSSLKGGNVRSCGCIRSGYLRNSVGHLPYGEAVFNLVVKMYRDNAIKHKLAWELSKEEARTLFKGDCHYCGDPPSRTLKGRAYGEFTYNGIDRVNNSKGYLKGNVVSCCTRCNFKKSEMSLTEFTTWIVKVANHMKLESSPAS